MTEALYPADAYLRSCEALVVAAADDAIVLNRTVFYPEGGGQPGDRGKLSGADASGWTIIDTVRRDDGTIAHVCEPGTPLPAPGTALTAAIDWDYRYRHMRTHTCLHLLCALVPFPVTGGSISQDKGRLDFDMTEGVDKPRLEAELNRLVAEDHPVGYRWISDDELQANRELIRTLSVAPPTGQGSVRLIEIEGTDLQPCGGTHVARIGEIGHVRLGKVEKKGKHNRRVNLHLD